MRSPLLIPLLIVLLIPAAAAAVPEYLNLRTPQGAYLLHILNERRIAPHQPAEERHFQAEVRARDYEGSRTRPAAISFQGNNYEARFVSRRGRLVLAKGSLHRQATGRVSVAHSHAFGCSQALMSSTKTRSLMSTGADLEPIFAPPRILQISTDGDYEFFQRKGVRGGAFVRSLLNAVESIYLHSLGIEFSLVEARAFSTQKQPYNADNLDELLDQFRDYTNKSKHLGKADVFHLFTGKNLLEESIGLAFVGTACIDKGSSAYSVSQLVEPALEPVLLAHELAHSLGAIHDAQSGWIMSPRVSTGGSSFSPESLLDIIAHVGNFGTCLAAGKPYTVSLSVNSKKGKPIELTATATGPLEEACTLILKSLSASNLPLKSKEIYSSEIFLKERYVSVSRKVTAAELGRSFASLTNLQARLACPGYEVSSQNLDVKSALKART